MCSSGFYSFFTLKSVICLAVVVSAINNETSEINPGSVQNPPVQVVVADHEHMNVSDVLPDSAAVNPPDSINNTTSSSTNATTTSSGTSGTTTAPITTPAATTTTTVITTSTTPKPTTTTTKKPRRRYVPNKRRVCGCDLHIHRCDMNCCCDLDCSKEEKLLFSDCYVTDFYEPKVTSHNSHSCFRSNIFYHENSPFIIRETSYGMFCVVTENVMHSDQLDPEPSPVDLKYFTTKKPKFTWDFIRKTQHPSILEDPYKYGSVILKVSRSTEFPQIRPFGLPTTLYGRGCLATEDAKFLQPLTTGCRQFISDIKADCRNNTFLNVNSFLLNTTFISNPSLINISEGLLSEAPILMASCSPLKDGSKNCEPVQSWSGPLWDETTSTCTNVLESLELTFVHAGIQGISKVIAKAQYGSYTSKAESIRQEFSTNFLWRSSSEPVVIPEDESASIENVTMAEDSNKKVLLPVEDDIDVSSVDFPRSGNPGYIVGKPVLMGTMVLTLVKGNQTKEKTEPKEGESTEQEETASSEGEKAEASPALQEKVVIALDKNPSGWMTIHNGGVCEKEALHRRNVLFGMGHHTECKIKVSKFPTCDNLQESITTIILGEASMNFSEKYVSAYGNPDLDNTDEWVPVYSSNAPTSLGKEGSIRVDQGCDGIISSLKIKIAFAHVGPVNYPQAKIIGVLYEFGDSFNIPAKLNCNRDRQCLLYQHEVTVATTVVFFDATKSPTLRIGQWPVVSIKLPHDFFYPFSATTSDASRTFPNWTVIQGALYTIGLLHLTKLFYHTLFIFVHGQT